ncbi:MAG: sigma-54-dependent Fis family transcriptional regulator [Spirochaetales bacterium]|nr:sigma-54-dependent Fis family transcriptional regulator [Spirochaetales bacterium]
MIRLLLIDDDPRLHETLGMVLSDEYTIISAYTGEEGIEKALIAQPDVVLLDVNLPDTDGISVLAAICSTITHPPVVMLTVSEDIKTAVKAIKTGAFDYINKPYELDELKDVLARAIRHRFYCREAPSSVYKNRIIGVSPAIQSIRTAVEKYAQTDSAVLVCGESGTGKELVAEQLHRLSYRRTGPYVKVNCSALPDSLVESELFGSEKGAFTDAVKKIGLFQQAEGGTILLDEIGEMSPFIQTKLLRAIENKEIMRIGGRETIKLDIRIVAATNRDLKQAIAEKTFREDLFYRLHVLTVTIPPLRDRKEDIPVLASHFTGILSSGEAVISDSAMDKLTNHSWPGNVRELKNVLERALVLSEGTTITPGTIVFP